jgi:hypothetical protein
MYIQNPTPATKEDIKAKLIPILIERKIKKFTDWELEALIDEFYSLNLALINKWSVWAECIKEPRGNLDTGRHYFKINYITEDHQQTTFWPVNEEFAKKLVYMTQWNRDWSVPKWSFSSGAIGMNRQLDATDSLFSLLKDLTGTYAQV